jgi:hypothetical protein
MEKISLGIQGVWPKQHRGCPARERNQFWEMREAWCGGGGPSLHSTPVQSRYVASAGEAERAETEACQNCRRCLCSALLLWSWVGRAEQLKPLGVFPFRCKTKAPLASSIIKTGGCWWLVLFLSKFDETWFYIKYMRLSLLCDTCTCTNLKV